MKLHMLDAFQVHPHSVWHLGWYDHTGRADCIGGCELFYAYTGTIPPRGRVCAKARKALGELLGERYEIVDVTEVRFGWKA